jgi:MbtH protein
MNREEQEDSTIYNVVVNHEEQYSIWPADRELAIGRRDRTEGPMPRLHQDRMD